MGLFNRFNRKINKNAKNRPLQLANARNSTSLFVYKDGAAFACIDRISSEFGLLNYSIYDRKTREKVAEHPLYSVLKQPNLDDRHFNFFYQSANDYFKKGAFWFKSYVNGEIVSLFRLEPTRVKVTRDIDTNRLVFYYNGGKYSSEEILYIPSRFDFSTKTGGSAISEALSSVFETSGNIEEYTQFSFKNGLVGGRPVINISEAYPDATAEQLQELKNSFQQEYAGPENAGRPLIEKDGITYKDFKGATDNRAADLKENRSFQQQQMAMIFAVSQGMLNGENIDSLENAFTTFNEFALRPMATQFEEAINSLLDEDKYYFEFDYNGVMKVSLASRVESYIKQINNAILSPNEVRGKENLPPIEAGDNYFMPVNMMPLNDETVEAYMAKQKNEIANSGHFPGGDDKS